MLGGSKVPFMHYMHIKSRGRCPEIFEFSHNLLRTDNLPASFAKFFFGLSPEPLRLLPNDIHRKLLNLIPQPSGEENGARGELRLHTPVRLSAADVLEG
jgi:hypothetical protein